MKIDKFVHIDPLPAALRRCVSASVQKEAAEAAYPAAAYGEKRYAADLTPSGICGTIAEEAGMGEAAFRRFSRGLPGGFAAKEIVFGHGKEA